MESKQEIRVLGILGSPRRQGNTELLLDEALNGARETGADTKKLVLNEMSFIPCQHCDSCLGTGKCKYQDDMQLVYPEIQAADRLVLASPVFFKGLTAQTKMMIDRCQALWALKYRLKQPVGLNRGGKRLGLFISVGGMGLPDLFAPAIATVKAFFKVIEMDYWGQLLYSRVDEKGEILLHPEALGNAYEAGRRLVLGLEMKALLVGSSPTRGENSS